MLAKLVRGMDPLRYRNVVVSLTDRGRLAESIEAAGVPVHCLNMKRGRIDFLALPRLVRMLKKIRPTILQTWLYHADLLGTVASIFGGRPPLAWNLRCSDMDLRHYPATTRLTLRMLAFCSRVPQVVIVNSQVGQRFHQAVGYRARRWEVISNGFDLVRFHQDVTARQRLCEELGLSTDAILVGLVARVDPMKDHDTFLDAAGLVAKARPTVRFLLVGRSTQTLKPAVDQRGLAGHVYLLGERGDVDRLLPGMDIACLSSISEGFPNVLGEAMACGIPCVSTDVGDVRSIIGDTGLVVPVRDPASLAHAIIDLIDRGPAARERLGRAARIRIETEYSLARVVDRYTALYSDLSFSNPSAR